MREFLIIKKNGIGMIVDARNKDEVIEKVGSSIISIEETFESKKRNKKQNIESKNLEKVFINDVQDVKKVDELILITNTNNNISAWEKKFIFGVKNNLKHNILLSEKQKYIVNELYTKLIG